MMVNAHVRNIYHYESRGQAALITLYWVLNVNMNSYNAIYLHSIQTRSNGRLFKASRRISVLWSNETVILLCVCV